MMDINNLIIAQRDSIEDSFTELAEVLETGGEIAKTVASLELVCRAMQDLSTIAVCMNELAANKRSELELASMQVAEITKIRSILADIATILQNKA